MISLIAVSIGCDESDPQPADMGVDMPATPAPIGIADRTWTSLQSFSPQTMDPPTDTTNSVAGDPSAIRFGQWLFFEEELSSTGNVSCATCHLPDQGFAGPEALAVEGVLGPDVPTGRHTPTLLNVGYVRWQFWDGRRDTLWGQAVGPLEHPVEMGLSRVELAHYIFDNDDVRQAYVALFGTLPSPGDIQPFPDRAAPVPDPQTDDQRALNDAWESMRPQDRDIINQMTANAMKAVAAYEMELVSFDAPFDRYVDQLREHPQDPEKWDAISDDAKEGARLFIEVIGCVECHNGPLLSDGKFHNIGLPARDWTDPTDPGRFNGLPQAKQDLFSSAGPFSDDPQGDRALLLQSLPAERDDHMGAMRTPSLRNLPRTGPYMHAGHFSTLQEVLDFYNELPEPAPNHVGTRSSLVRNLELTDERVAFLEAFLLSLDGQAVPDELKTRPSSPAP